MAYYPNGRFVGEFARRTSENIEAIAAGERLQWEDTALISFLLAVFVLPHERSEAKSYMADIVAAYPQPLEKVVRTVRFRPGLTDHPLSDLTELPRLLRHAVAHFNLRPVSKDMSDDPLRV